MEKIKKYKVLIIVLFLFIILVVGLVSFYKNSLKSVSKESEPITFVVQNGASKITIAENLKTAGLVRNKYALLLYLYFNSDLNLQAGTYSLDKNMNVKEIISKINKGDVRIDTITFTFIEGKTVNDFIKLIADKFKYTENEVKNVLMDKEFNKLMVEKYDFLTDEVLNDNIYYALEGYLFPDTYEVLENATIEDILVKMLDNTKKKLDALQIDTSKYSIHEILSLASVIEVEVVTPEDRVKVAQVNFKRLENKMGLGSDKTTCYALQKSECKGLTKTDLASVNPYNTRDENVSMHGKIPVGPICNPSLTSIQAVLNPSDTDYLYYVANLCTGETFFNADFMEHSKKARELKSVCDKN